MNKDKTAIIVLGAPNDEHGTLSSIAKERCGQALKEFQRSPESRIITTGGWGKHFNTTKRPHGHYLREYLKARGIPDRAFLECAESSNTIEDAKLCRPIVERHGLGKLIVVTSDFHVARARFVFQREFPGVPFEFSASKTELPERELRERILHETTALAKLEQNSKASFT